MAKILLSVELPDSVIDDVKESFKKFIENKQNDWFTVDGKISIDRAYLECDKEDDDFYVFGFHGIKK